MESWPVFDFVYDRWRRRHWRPSADLKRFETMRPVVVITGGSAGIGLALARQFVRARHHVLLVARHRDRLDSAVRALNGEAGGQATALVADLSNAESGAAIETALAQRNAYCDVLVNNAAIGLAGPFHSHSSADLLTLLDLNVRCVSCLMHRFLPGMLERGRGGILNIASLGGYMPGPYQAAYYASKAHMISLTQAVAFEARGCGVRICAVAPGPVATEFHSRMGSESAYYAILKGLLSAERVAKSAYRGYRCGRTMIVPGVLYKALALLLPLIPHAVLVPLIGWMLKQRR